MWSWLIPQTENLIEYFGAATGSCSTISCTTPAPPGSAANAIPDNPAITPTEPSIPLAALFRNARRPTSSALIPVTPPISFSPDQREDPRSWLLQKKYTRHEVAAEPGSPQTGLRLWGG